MKKGKFHHDIVYNFKELQFFKKYIEKRKIKRLKIIDLFPELPCYKELNVIKTDRVFKGYTISYKVVLKRSN